MAITTYAELQTAIQGYLHRDDLDEAEFIALAEKDIRTDARFRNQEQRSTAATVANQQNYALPTDFRELRWFRLNTTPKVYLEWRTPPYLNDLWDSGATGQPCDFTIMADDLYLGPTPDAVYTMEILYYKNLPALSDSQTSNWLLAQHEGIYLAGAMKWACLRGGDPEGHARWSAIYEAGMNDLKTSDSAGRAPRGGMLLRTDGALRGGGRYNINSDR